MIEYSLPELPLREVVLDCVDPVRGGEEGVGAPPPLAGRISLGGPDSRPITRAMVAKDSELLAYLEDESRFHEYYLVQVAMSFAVRPVTPRLTSATLALSLTSTVSPPEPAAVSMTPWLINSSVQRERTIKFGPQLTILEVEASLGEISTKTTSEQREPFLRALKLRTSEPCWEFTRTKTMELANCHDLVMVVRTARNSSTGITCQVSARTRGNITRRWAERELPDPLILSSVL